MGHFLSHKSPDLFHSGRSVLASLPYSREFLIRSGRRGVRAVQTKAKDDEWKMRLSSFFPPFLKFPLSLLSSIPLRLRKALTHSLTSPPLLLHTRVKEWAGRMDGMDRKGREEAF